MNSGRISKTLLALAVSALIIGGCGGGGAKVEATTTNTSTTMGQELMDLNEARTKGIIDEEQYEKSKQEILKRYEK